MTIHIPGSKITLRDFVLADISALRTWLQPGHDWQELDGPYYPRAQPEEIDATLDTLEGKIDQANWPDPRRKLAIAVDDALIGQVTRYWLSQETDWAAIGIVIYDPRRWRHGFGYEALGLWTDYLLTRLPHFARLDLRTWSGNIGMMKLATKLGFVQEACFRKARIVHGAYFDGLGYGILREEWQQRYPDGFAAHLSERHKR